MDVCGPWISLYNGIYMYPAVASPGVVVRLGFQDYVRAL